MTGFNPDIHMPGVWRCAKCSFQLHSMTMNMAQGTIGAKDEPGEKCPNDGSPMWRVTWKEAYNTLYDENAEWIVAKRIIDRLIEEEGATVSLVGPNPDFNGMPDNCVFVSAWFTDHKDQDFRADTVLDCLRLAEEAKRAWEARQ